MFSSISSWLGRASTGRVALLATVVFLLFTALVLPRQAEEADAVSGGAGSPDTSLFYTAQDLYRMAEAYGEAGRGAYVRARWTFDAVFPLVYAFFLITAISWLSRYSFRIDGLWQRANLIPLGAMLFDYLENSATSVVMFRYPESTPPVDVLAPVLTLVKWILVSASFILLVLVALAGAARFVGARRKLT